MNNQLSNQDLEGQDKPATSQQPGGAQQTDIVVTKRSAVRQKLAIALMAIGGALVAGFIWYSLYGKKSG